jgi:selenium-binding protein 1
MVKVMGIGVSTKQIDRPRRVLSYYSMATVTPVVHYNAPEAFSLKRDHTMTLHCRIGLVALLVALLALAWLGHTQAETCLSPFVKRLERPEKLLYVYCVDADAKDNDFLAVIDVQQGSPSFAKVVYQLDLGSAGNETHHFGYTDDRQYIWGLTLFSNRAFLIDVATDPAKPRLVKVIENLGAPAGFSSPHSAYGLPGQMLISFLSGKDGGLPTGLAKFTNDGQFVSKIDFPAEAPYGYDVAVKPDLNRMVTSSFTFYNNYKKPLAEMDFKKFGSEILMWDFRAGKQLARLKTGGAPLECRWSLKPGANHGFTNCALDDSLWLWQGDASGNYTTRKLCATGKLPADLRQSPDDAYLFVSCFGSDEIQQWDVRDLDRPRLASTLKPGVQPNMMHVTSDGKRMYITNSLLSTMDRPTDFWVKRAYITPEGMKLDDSFRVDLMRFSTGPARGHDMLLN